MMKLAASAVALSLLVLVAVPGCDASVKGDATATGDGGTFELPPPGLSEADAQKICDTIRSPECRRLERCAPNMLAVLWGDLATCIARNTLQCKLAMTLRGVAITQAQADACATKYEAAACDSREATKECELPGVVADGGPCLSDNQCKSANCVGGNVATCGKCTAQPAEVKGAAIGAACKASKDCEDWAICKDGKCIEAGRAKGQPCTENYNCLQAKGLVCDDLAGCIEITAVAATGEACPSDTKAFTGTFCKDGICDPNQTPTKCLPRSGEGAPCGTAETECALPYSCDSGTKTCVIPPLDYEGTCKLKQ